MDRDRLALEADKAAWALLGYIQGWLPGKERGADAEAIARLRAAYNDAQKAIDVLTGNDA